MVLVVECTPFLLRTSPRARLASWCPSRIARPTSCSSRRSSSRQTRTPTTSTTVTRASTAAASVAARLAGAANAGVNLRPTWAYMGYKWTEEKEDAFEVEAIVGNIVEAGCTAYAKQGKAAAGVVLYHIDWKGYPSDMVWYEPGENLGSELL
eukprot:2723436-Pleurochrysis_carterae.AAC.1